MAIGSTHVPRAQRNDDDCWNPDLSSLGDDEKMSRLLSVPGSKEGKPRACAAPLQ